MVEHKLEHDICPFKLVKCSQNLLTNSNLIRKNDEKKDEKNLIA